MNKDVSSGPVEEQELRRKKFKEYPLPDEFQEYDDRRRMTLIWLVLLVVLLIVLIVILFKVI